MALKIQILKIQILKNHIAECTFLRLILKTKNEKHDFEKLYQYNLQSNVPSLPAWNRKVLRKKVKKIEMSKNTNAKCERPEIVRDKNSNKSFSLHRGSIGR